MNKASNTFILARWDLGLQTDADTLRPTFLLGIQTHEIPASNLYAIGSSLRRGFDARISA